MRTSVRISSDYAFLMLLREHIRTKREMLVVLKFMKEYFWKNIFERIYLGGKRIQINLARFKKIPLSVIHSCIYLSGYRTQSLVLSICLLSVKFSKLSFLFISQGYFSSLFIILTAYGHITLKHLFWTVVEIKHTSRLSQNYLNGWPLDSTRCKKLECAGGAMVNDT